MGRQIRNKLLRIVACGLLLAPCLSLNAQWVTIPDSNFVNWLNANIPQCMNGNQMDTTCAGVVSRPTVDCSSKGIVDLTGIEYFDQIIVLYCYDNLLVTLPVLPTYLSFLHCSENHLISLPPLPYDLKSLYCNDNQLTNLPSLPQSLTDLNCLDNQLTSLPSLPQSLDILRCRNNLLAGLPTLPPYLRELSCVNNQITGLPSLPQSLLSLYCSENPLAGLPVLPPGLIDLECIDNHLISLPALPQTLHYFACDGNQLTILPPLPQHGLTYWFTCSYNQLTALPALPDSMNYFNCSNNPDLTCLPELKRIDRFVFRNTGITCLPNYGSITSSNPLLNSLPICDTANANGCAVFLGDISGTIISETGVPIPGVTVTLTGNETQTTTTQSDGRFNFAVPVGGTYTVTPSKSNDLTTNNGITSIDVLQIRRHILGMLPLPSPSKIIAADVDGSSTVTTLDILHTRSMILQMTTTFPNGRLWSFVPSDYVFPDMQNPFPFPTSRTYTNLQQSVTGQDFIGIKLGDVNGNWDAGVP